jgi:hypothetical protein
MKRPHITRDGILFLGGLLGAAHETIIASAERPTLLVLFGVMMGLPAFLPRHTDKDEDD